MGELEQVVDGKADLEFTIKVDLMPEFELTDVSKLKIERLTAEVTDADVDEALKRLAEQSRTYSLRSEDGAAKLDDMVTIDFGRPHRRRGIYGRQGRRFQSHARLGPADPRLRGAASSAPRRARRAK